MNRLDKKCFIASAALHGLLLVSFVAGSAFLSSKSHVKLPPVITMVNAIPTDKLIASGGNPNGEPAPAAPLKQETPPPQPEPPPPVKEEIKPPEPEPEPEPPKQKKTEVVQKSEKAPALPKEKGHEPKPMQTAKTDSPKTPINLKPVRRTNDLARIQQEAAATAARAAADRKRQEEWRRQRQQLANEAGRILDGVGSSLETRSVAAPVGPGGAAYVNYASLVIEHYKRAVYASNPQSDNDAEAVIKVVIARDGAVRSSQWVRRTSNPVLNKAVDRAMSTVKSLPEFPPEAKDSERTFNITIAFEARRGSA